MKLAALVLAASATLLGGVAEAQAHAALDHASPSVGSTVHGSPPEVKIWYTEGLEPAFSTIEVVDQSGKRVDKGDNKVDSSDNTLLEVSLPPLQPGTYQVNWRVLSVDTHVTNGHFKFQVVP